MPFISILFSTYIFASILKPFEIIDSTAQFISLLFAKPKVSIASHIANTLALIVGFIVLYHLIAIHCIYDFAQSYAKTTKASTAPKKLRKQTKAKVNDVTPKKVDEPKVVVEQPVTQEPKPIIQKAKEKPMIQEEPIVQKTVAPIAQETATPIVQETSVTPAIQETVTPATVEKQEEPKPITDKEDPTTQQAEEPVIDKPTVPSAPIVLDSPIYLSPHHDDDGAPSTKVNNQVTEEFSHVDAEQPVNDTSSIKEQYYNELLRKDSNIMSLSDNLQRIFDQPISPSPDENNSNSTPALTPPHPSSSSAAGSTLSRKSSLASQHSQFKSRLQVAMQKVAKSGPKTEDQQKKRFSLHRKSKIMDSDVVVDVAPKRSISTKFQKGLKNTGKRFSKIFS